MKKLERIPEVNKYFSSTISRDTLKFRQTVGMAVRLALEEQGFKTTGRRGTSERSHNGSLAQKYLKKHLKDKGIRHMTPLVK